MNTTKALECLSEYVKNHIEDVNKLEVEDDNGNRALILLCQEKYNFFLGLPLMSEVEGFPPPPVSELRDAIFQSYEPDRLEELSGRKYVADILLNRNFDTEFYVNEVMRYLKKLYLKGLDRVERYEVTHLCWCIYMIGKDNHILSKYKALITNALIEVYHLSPSSDEGTECLYFLSVVNPEAIKEEWMFNLSQIQKKDGCFPGDWSRERVHHTGLALLTEYNYNHQD